MAADLEYRNSDNWGQIFRKILQNLYALVSGAITINVNTGGGGAPVSAPNTITIAVTGTAIEAIPANSAGYITAALGNGASIFVGDATVTNGGARRGLELTQAGTSPLLRGPVYINGTVGDIGGVLIA